MQLMHGFGAAAACSDSTCSKARVRCTITRRPPLATHLGRLAHRFGRLVDVHWFRAEVYRAHEPIADCLRSLVVGARIDKRSDEFADPHFGFREHREIPKAIDLSLSSVLGDGHVVRFLPSVHRLTLSNSALRAAALLGLRARSAVATGCGASRHSSSTRNVFSECTRPDCQRKSFSR